MTTKATGTLLTACILTGIILPGQAKKLTKQKEKKPVNIVMFIADDLGANDISPYGNRVVRTPHLELLASESILFHRAFASSPTCAPSRASIHTGQMPFRNGAHANHSGIKEGIKTMPSWLQSLGYRVALAGKLHIGPMSSYPFELIHETNVPEPGHEKDGVLWTDLNMAPVDDWLAKVSKEKEPFVLVVNDHSPHVIWPEKAEYDPAEVDIPGKHIDTESTRKSRARYYTDITKMDTNLGKLLQSLEVHGCAGNTVVIFTCDQGPQWAFGKWNLYDYGIRVPLLIRWPGKIKGRNESHALVSLVDLLPTAIEIAGGKAPSEPEQIDGKSLLPLLLGQTSSHRTEVFASHTGDGNINVAPMRMVRTERFKYIQNLAPGVIYNTHINLAKDHDGGREYWDSWITRSYETEQAAYALYRYHNRPAEELYDVITDPNETRNLAGNPHYKKELEAFRVQMSRWREQQGDKETGPFTYPKNDGKGPVSPYIFK